MLDIDLFNNEYMEYKYLKKLFDEKRQELDDYRQSHDNLMIILPVYNILIRDERLKHVQISSKPNTCFDKINGEKINNTIDYSSKYRRKLSDDFLMENPSLIKFLSLKDELDKLEEDLNGIINDSQVIDNNDRYIVLKKDSDRKLMSLYSKTEIDINDFDEGEYEYLTQILRKNSSFVGEVDVVDLPFIMNLTHQYNEYGLDNLRTYGFNRSIDDEFSREINKAINFAKNFDSGKISLEQLTILKQLLFELDKKKRKLRNDEYFQKYITLKMLEDHDVETLYSKCSDKILFLKTYFDLSHFGYEIRKDNYFSCGKILTASPTVNRDLLKNEELVKKRRCNIITFN